MKGIPPLLPSGLIDVLHLMSEAQLVCVLTAGSEVT